MRVMRGGAISVLLETLSMTRCSLFFLSPRPTCRGIGRSQKYLGGRAGPRATLLEHFIAARQLDALPPLSSNFQSAADMAALSVSYSITRPASAPSTSLPPTSTKSYALTTSTPETHLQSLEAALGKARDALNEDLTQWKVAVGAFEVVPKDKKGKSADDDGDEDEDEE